MIRARRISWRRQVPWGVVGTLCLVWSVEKAVERHALDLTDFSSPSWKRCKKAVTGAAKGAEILCFGDSLTKFGILPQFLEAELGKRTYNLGLFAGQAPADYFLLRRTLESGAHPAAILVNFKNDFLALDPQNAFTSPHWPELLDVQECAELAWSTHDSRFFAMMMLSRALPSVQNREGLRTRLLMALRGETSKSWSQNLSCLRNLTVNCGAVAMPRNPSGPPDINPDRVLKNSCFLNWICHPVNAKYVDRFFRLSSSHHIPVFLVIPPVTPQFQALSNQAGIEARYETFLRKLVARFPNIVVLDGRRSGYDKTLFQDYCHLNGEGAMALSQGLAQVLESYLDGSESSRWTELPASGGRRQPGLALETLDQSRLALQGLDRVRR